MAAISVKCLISLKTFVIFSLCLWCFITLYINIGEKKRKSEPGQSTLSEDPLTASHELGVALVHSFYY